MKTELEKYKKYVSDIKFLANICGIWPKSNARVQRLIAYIGVITVSLTFLGGINSMLHSELDIMIVTKLLSLLFALSSACLKILIIRHYQDDILNLDHYLTAQFNRDLCKPELHSMLLVYFRPFSKLFYTLTYSVGLSSGVAVVVVPMIGLSHGEYKPVGPQEVPIEYEPGDLIYWVLQLYMSSGVYYVWAVTSSVDSMFGMYTLQICGQLRVLASNFENLGMAKNYKAVLADCIKRYQLLLKSKNTLEGVYGFLIIYLVITSAISQCTLVFQASQMIKNVNPAEIAFLASFLILKLTQAFMFAWFGNLIEDESERCLSSIYNAAWSGSGNSRFMKDVLIILMQKPMIFKAMHCMPLKMEVFSKIVNTSVSYFFLLQTLDEDANG